MVPIGEGVFETLLIVDSRPHALTRHLARLRTAATTLGLDVPADTELRRRIAEHVATHPLPYGRMRLTLTSAGDDALISIASEPTDSPAAAVRLTVSDWQVGAQGPLVGLKSTDYVDYLASLREARRGGFDEALLTNTSGHVCEATTANVFFVLDGVLCTPALSTGCLPGIARGLIVELCGAAEVAVQVDGLAEATEVFLTSSLRGVQAVSQVDDRAYLTTGPFVTAAQDAWRDLAERIWDPPPVPAAECEIEERVR